MLDEVNCKKFLQLKQLMLPEVEMVQFLYTNQLQHNTTYNYDTEYRPKLYKRLREFVWEDPLHESVRREPVIYDRDIAIIHMPAHSAARRATAGSITPALQRTVPLSETVSVDILLVIITIPRYPPSRKRTFDVFPTTV